MVVSDQLILLATAYAYVMDGYGASHRCRILCDPGSQASFITCRFFNRLALRRIRCEIPVEGVGSSTSTYTRGRATIQLSNFDTSFGLAIDVYMLDTITSTTPATAIAESCWTHLRTLQLADPTFGSPGQIDILVGADVWGAIVEDGIVRGARHEPYAQHTRFGWVVFGPATIEPSPPTSMRSLLIHTGDNQHLDDLLRKFWELEEADSSMATAEVDLCEQIFLATHYRAPDGRYVVQIPFRPDAPILGNSHSLALRQFHQLERKLSSKPELREKYVAFMRGYITLGHMQAVADQHDDPSQGYYIPHHAVTAKFRVVFNASARTTTGVSLNDTQLAGPTIQELLVNIILRFRRFAVALSADVEKMFRQVRVDERHRRWQRILWRESPHEPLLTYELTTVTYGMACGPYNAIRAMQQCGRDNSHILADGSRAAAAQESIDKDFYVDDYLASVESTERAVELAKDIDTVLQHGHFHLRKWRSNDAAALAQITSTFSSTDEIELNSPETTVLGLHWNPITDNLFYKIKLDDSPSDTKRRIVSDTARLYDPINMLAPVIIVAKMYIQRLWLEQLDWDTPVPTTILNEWLTYRHDLRKLEAIRIPRWVGLRPGVLAHLHGFCDASSKAYAAVIYLRSTTAEGEPSSMMVTAKTKVAPVKTMTIPRLELCAAQLLTITMSNVRQALALTDVPYSMWTDSTIVLGWLRKHPSTLNVYVSNRVAYIQQHTDVKNWHHVRTEHNPADCASRGITADELREHRLWWHGPPSMLHRAVPAEEPPTLNEAEEAAMVTEVKPIRANVARPAHPFTLETRLAADGTCIDLIDRYSNIGKLLRTTAYILRWRLAKRHLWRHTVVNSDEIEGARRWHIRAEQGKYFSAEIQRINHRQAMAVTSKLIPLAPYLDEHDILRVNGRLKNANLSENQRNPIILPTGSVFTRLVVQQVHDTTLHGGIQLMLHTLRQTYWILNGRTAVKQCIRSCTICRRHSKAMAQQQMAALPRQRVNQAPPFSSSGVDYCGPFQLRVGTQRSRTLTKTYVCIFVCMTTKAVHIDVAHDLSARAFLNVFARFTARRGPCSQLYSDNGTAFVGANRIMRQDLAEWRNAYTQQQVANAGTQWRFNPPGAPHQGGLWEAAVKSAKRHLIRVVGEQSLFFDSFYTLLARIEACMNSRPLIPLHDSVDDRIAPSPADILIGRSLIAVPEPPIPEVPNNRLKQWQQVQQMHQHFWQFWHDEYLATLQAHNKWQRPSDNLQVDDVVVIRHENIPPGQWRLGRITEVHPGADGLVRNVTIRHARGSCTRPVQKVCRLLTADQEE